MRKFTLLLLIALLIIPSAMLFAGTTGKLIGKVADQDGKPISGAVVMIQSIKAGARTKADGNFVILNIPPGIYEVVSMRQGYGPVKITNIKIVVDETTKENITLRKQSIKVEGITVIERKTEVVSKAVQGSKINISSAQLENAVDNSIEGMLSNQKGVTKGSDGELHIRGGRSTEVAYTIDGMSVSDPVNGGNALTVDSDAVESMSATTGGFTAEYGNAMSGVVNMVTKSGSKDFEGKVEYKTDTFYDENSRNMDELKFNLGGPVLPWLDDDARGDFTFFINITGRWSDGLRKDEYDLDPNDIIPTLTKDYEAYNSQTDPYRESSYFGKWDGKDSFFNNLFGKSTGLEITRRNYNSNKLSFKTKYKIDNKSAITFAINQSNSFSYPYSRTYRFALHHYMQSEARTNNMVATFDKTIGDNKNLKVKASYFKNVTKASPKGLKLDDFYYLTGDPVNGQIEGLDSDNNNNLDNWVIDDDDWQFDAETENLPIGVVGYAAPGTYYDAIADDQTETFTLRSDFEWQMNQTHSFKTGFEIIKNKIKRYRLDDLAGIDENKVQDYLDKNFEQVVINDSTGAMGYASIDRLAAIKATQGTADGYEAEPWQFAYYLQDAMDYEGMRVNAGIRFDAWYLNDDYTINTPDYKGSYLELIKPTNPDVPTYEAELAYYKRLKDKFEDVKLMISPRLGVTHPISEEAVVHFAYNYQQQLPAMAYIFKTASPEQAETDDGVVLGNPELEPQVAVTYEAGIKQQLSDYQVFDITAYYKNTYNYVSQKEYKSNVNAGQSYYKYISENYGSSRGVDIGIDRYSNNYIGGSMVYSLSWAYGNNSTVNDDENLREFPLNWDTRHSFKASLDYRVGKDEEANIETLLDFFILPFPFHFIGDFTLTDYVETDIVIPFDNFFMAASYNISSGKPYSATTKEGKVIEMNGENMEFTDNMDFKFGKTFSLDEDNKRKLKFYGSISNVFNRQSARYVYGYTGEVWDDGWDNDGDIELVSPEQWSQRNEYIRDPDRKTTPRTYEAGVAFYF